MSLPTVGRFQSIKGMGRLAKGVGRAIAHKGESILQDPAEFKFNAMALSSFLLVIARVTIASYSAAKAQGTPDGPYRTQESIRTDIREIGGVSSSYGLMLAVTLLLKAAMRKAWGIPTAEGYALWKNIREAAKNRHDPAFKVKRPDWAGMLSRSENFVANPEKAKGLLAVINAIRRIFNKPTLKNDAEKISAIGKVYTWTPVVLSGGMALYVSGMLLERFTRNHSNDVVDWINSKSGASQPLQPEYFSVPAYALRPRTTDPSLSPTSPSANPFSSAAG
jgi:hypothetical protein